MDAASSLKPMIFKFLILLNAEVIRLTATMASINPYYSKLALSKFIKN
jgi:hypothetical protein